MRDETFDLLKFRVGGITNLDAPSLYGKVAHRSVGDLWREKTELEDSAELRTSEQDVFTAAMSKVEEQLYGEDVGRFRSCFMVNHAMPFLRAELDAAVIAYTRDGKESLSKSVFAFVSVVPLTYFGFSGPVREDSAAYVEFQHVFAVTGFGRGYLVTTVDGSEIKMVEVKRDDVFISNHVAECIQFWDLVRRGVSPTSTKDLDNAPGASV